ncbi:MAG: hypothetical protein JXO44_13190 [Clostridia bacterium]|nr:hypothetical protein [Clostridia bacterium]
MRSGDKIVLWQSRLDAQKTSGLSRRAWCEANQVNFHNFQYWHKKLSVIQATPEPNKVRFMSIFPESTTHETNMAIKISIGAITIELAQPISALALDTILSVASRYA